MSYPHQGESRGLDGQRAEQPRSAFAGPQLNLPRFQFAPSTPAPASPPPAPAPAPTYSQPAPTHAQPAPTYAQPVPSYAQPAPSYAQPAHPAPASYQQPTYQQPTYQQPTYATHAQQPQHAAPQPQGQLAYAMAPAPSAAAVAPRPAAPRPAPQLMANTTTPRATVSWDSGPPVAEQTLLQRITPVHMGVLMVIVMAVMVMTSGPVAMNAAPARLPAVTTSGGGSVPMPVRAGTTAVAAASAPAGAAKTAAAPAAGAKGATKAAPRVRRGTRMIAVGNARVRANVRAGGIPSAAASANLAIAGGGRVSAADTGSVQMGGIPSPAASEQLGPQKLPFRPTDGVTLPRAIGERDSHAVDRHYGTSATLPMEEPALPAMTPGAAAARAEHQVQVNNLTGGSTPQPVAGGLAMAY